MPEVPTVTVPDKTFTKYELMVPVIANAVDVRLTLAGTAAKPPELIATFGVTGTLGPSSCATTKY